MTRLSPAFNLVDIPDELWITGAPSGARLRDGTSDNVFNIKHSPRTGYNGDQPASHVSWWDKSDISPGADTLACARPAARVKAGPLAAHGSELRLTAVAEQF
jgi:hypothetical protein